MVKVMPKLDTNTYELTSLKMSVKSRSRVVGYGSPRIKVPEIVGLDLLQLELTSFECLYYVNQILCLVLFTEQGTKSTLVQINM